MAAAAFMGRAGGDQRGSMAMINVSDGRGVGRYLLMMVTW